MRRYPLEIEYEMKTFYDSLNEKDRRRYAAVEALKLGHGGKVYIAQVVGCNRNTITKGLEELQSGQVRPADRDRIRRVGGGRKRAEASDASVEAGFLALMETYTAGNPMDAAVRWTSLSPREIAERLSANRESAVGVGAVRRLLSKHDYRRRQLVKKNDAGCG